MPTYNAPAVTNAVIGFKKPVTMQLLQALRDNPIAMAEGQPGAPRTVGAAMAGTTSGTTVQRNVMAFGNEFLSAGDETLTRAVPQSAFTALVDCAVQVYVSCTNVSAGQVNVLKNGVSVQSYGNVSGGTVDVTLAAGDTLGIQLSATGSGGAEASITLTACQYRVTARSVVMT
jgi:hypothetical protein